MLATSTSDRSGRKTHGRVVCLYLPLPRMSSRTSHRDSRGNRVTGRPKPAGARRGKRDVRYQLSLYGPGYRVNPPRVQNTDAATSKLIALIIANNIPSHFAATLRLYVEKAAGVNMRTNQPGHLYTQRTKLRQSHKSPAHWV